MEEFNPQSTAFLELAMLEVAVLVGVRTVSIMRCRGLNPTLNNGGFAEDSRTLP